MSKYQVVEKFLSINGEGKHVGKLAVFIRFKGCNLKCNYCDTSWANETDAPYTELTKEEIKDYIMMNNVNHVTITGGEPLLQKNIKELLKYLTRDTEIIIEIETNGSIFIEPFIMDKVEFTLDYKPKGSGIEMAMNTENYAHLRKNDTVKFVCSSIQDLQESKSIMDTYNLYSKCHLYLSPVFDRIEPAKMVQFMISNNMNNVKLQLQLHKFIWHPDEKGV